MPETNKIICGAMPEATKVFPDGYFNCSISSPPYWALRDYGLPLSIWDGDENCKHKWTKEPKGGGRIHKEWCAGQRTISKNAISARYDNEFSKCSTGNFCQKCGAWRGSLGLEPTFELYIKHLCDIYDEVKRVLRDDGTCWVNLGDTYSASSTHASKSGATYYDGISGDYGKKSGRAVRSEHKRFEDSGIPQKSLCLIPQRFAIEMVNRGWILRNFIIWHKPNPMPSSATDRFTVDFEQVFYFVKSNKATYYIHPRKLRSSDKKKFDYIWIHRNTGLEVDYQPFSDRLCKGKKRLWNRRNLWEGRDYWFEPQYEPHARDWTGCGGNLAGKGLHKINDEFRDVGDRTDLIPNPLGRNKRCVWTIPTQSFPDAHFATFPEKLVEPMIKAGCPEFVCTNCGKAREKIWEKGELVPDEPQYKPRGRNKPEIGVKTAMTPAGSKQGHPNFHYETNFKGYTDCGCGKEWRPGRTLDCFLWVRDYFTGGRKAAA